MTEKAKKYLADILQAIELVEDFSRETTDFFAYQKDLKTKSAVERQLGIIGEAVNQCPVLWPSITVQAGNIYLPIETTFCSYQL